MKPMPWACWVRRGGVLPQSWRGSAQVDLHLGTLSKAFGLSGGYLAASRQVIDLLINRARSFIYSTAAAISSGART
jgi:7-keto-8-aminopelargonate synthetase-like enzyme